VFVVKTEKCIRTVKYLQYKHSFNKKNNITKKGISKEKEFRLNINNTTYLFNVTSLIMVSIDYIVSD